MGYILGIDQGHSETRAAISDMDGNILALRKSAGSCHSVHGLDATMTTILQASNEAIEAAGIHQADLSVLYAGLTGADWPDEYELLHHNLRKLGLCKNVYVKNDSIIALRGGTSATYGAILIAGTGGNCAIRSPSGEEFIYHFYHDRDLQGGIALGERVLKAVYRAETGRELKTQLTNSTLDLFKMENVNDLLRADVENKLDHSKLKELAPLVFLLAHQADSVACKIVRSFGEGLSELVTAGLRRFDMNDLDVEVVLSGSVFKGPGRLVEEVLISKIHMVAPKAKLVNARYEPVVGAILLGLESFGIEINKQLEINIDESSRKHKLIRNQNRKEKQI